MEYDLTRFRIGAEALGYHLTDEQYRMFLTYYDMLIEKNKVMNLTAITEFNDVITKHFIDSLSISQACDHLDGHVLDLGTGAGFPGIPLKIANPGLTITLMDSLNKRVKFLQEVICELHLTRIDAVHGRAEEMARNKAYREKYDFVVSRAVANIATLSEYCLPFVKVGGEFISYKSGEIDKELEEGKFAIRTLGGKIEKTQKFTLPDSDFERTLLVIRKKKPTPKVYPRKAGTPSKEPLHGKN